MVLKSMMALKSYNDFSCVYAHDYILGKKNFFYYQGTTITVLYFINDKK